MPLGRVWTIVIWLRLNFWFLILVKCLQFDKAHDWLLGQPNSALDLSLRFYVFVREHKAIIVHRYHHVIWEESALLQLRFIPLLFYCFSTDIILQLIIINEVKMTFLIGIEFERTIVSLFLN